MERSFTVITETAGEPICSIFRFKEDKAIELARHGNEMTNTRRHHMVRVVASDLIPYEPIALDEDGNPREDGECEEWGLYDVIGHVKRQARV